MSLDLIRTLEPGSDGLAHMKRSVALVAGGVAESLPPRDAMIHGLRAMIISVNQPRLRDQAGTVVLDQIGTAFEIPADTRLRAACAVVMYCLHSPSIRQRAVRMVGAILAHDDRQDISGPALHAGFTLHERFGDAAHLVNTVSNWPVARRYPPSPAP